MAHFGSNALRTKAYNRRVVLETIRMAGPLSRAEIARISELTPQTVSNITAGLIGENLVRELGAARGGGRGSPSLPLTINGDGGATLGIELRPDRMALAMVDFAGRMRRQLFVRLERADPQAVAGVARRGLAELASQSGLDGKPVLGAGIVMPGPFRADYFPAGPTELPGWGETDAVALFEEVLAMPCLVENDAVAAAVGERLHGRAGNLKDFAFLHFGVGLGLGLVLDGQPYTGHRGNAGEIGHFLVEPGGRPCSCGERGCLEQYVSFQALREDMRRLGKELGPEAEIDPTRDAAVAEWCRQASRRLRPVVMMLENVFDPETVVIGGSAPARLLDAICAGLSPLPGSIVPRSGRGVPRVVRGTSGPLAPVFGAAALPLFHSFVPDLKRAAIRAGAARGPGRSESRDAAAKKAGKEKTLAVRP